MSVTLEQSHDWEEEALVFRLSINTRALYGCSKAQLWTGSLRRKNVSISYILRALADIVDAVNADSYTPPEAPALELVPKT